METKLEAIERIEDLIGLVTAKFGEEDAGEQKWMSDLCSPAAQRILAGLSVQSLHLLDAVPADDGTDASVNIVGLARVTGVPKGTVSKAVQRFVDQGAVVRHQRSDNRKEVHLRLTPVGEEIQRAHRSLHKQMGAGLSEFMDRYTASELSVITRVLDDLLRMPRDGLRFRPDLLD